MWFISHCLIKNGCTIIFTLNCMESASNSIVFFLFSAASWVLLCSPYFCKCSLRIVRAHCTPFCGYACSQTSLSRIVSVCHPSVSHWVTRVSAHMLCVLLHHYQICDDTTHLVCTNIFVFRSIINYIFISIYTIYMYTYILHIYVDLYIIIN